MRIARFAFIVLTVSLLCIAGGVKVYCRDNPPVDSVRELFLEKLKVAPDEWEDDYRLLLEMLEDVPSEITSGERVYTERVFEGFKVVLEVEHEGLGGEPGWVFCWRRYVYQNGVEAPTDSSILVQLDEEGKVVFYDERSWFESPTSRDDLPYVIEVVKEALQRKFAIPPDYRGRYSVILDLLQELPPDIPPGREVSVSKMMTNDTKVKLTVHNADYKGSHVHWNIYWHKYWCRGEFEAKIPRCSICIRVKNGTVTSFFERSFFIPVEVRGEVKVTKEEVFWKVLKLVLRDMDQRGVDGIDGVEGVEGINETRIHGALFQRGELPPPDVYYPAWVVEITYDKQYGTVIGYNAIIWADTGEFMSRGPLGVWGFSRERAARTLRFYHHNIPGYVGLAVMIAAASATAIPTLYARRILMQR